MIFSRKPDPILKAVVNRRVLFRDERQYHSELFEARVVEYSEAGSAVKLVVREAVESYRSGWWKTWNLKVLDVLPDHAA